MLTVDNSSQLKTAPAGWQEARWERAGKQVNTVKNCFTYREYILFAVCKQSRFGSILEYFYYPSNSLSHALYHHFQMEEVP